MSEDDLLRSTLRTQWHIAATGIRKLPGGVLSDAWEVTAADTSYLVRLSAGLARGAVEAGLAAADHLRR
ncbi:MAG: hypothetical protein QOH97_5052, partial [Actinoplanes sp.]|nr:hypothetical protein [Actinoplanes sp.]